jgi:ubiquinone/menaquinone biosynthesis C-methylase UbiE
MLHHLPRTAREQCARELRRVTKRGGRVVAVDFGAPMKRGFLTHFHRHGHVKLPEILRVLTDAELVIEESGALGIHDLQFVVARAP